MSVTRLIVVLMVSFFCSNVFAYGSSSSKKACAKPKLSQFSPIHLATVLPQSQFSFLASALSNPETIVVSVKKQLVDVEIKKINKGYSVQGVLPASLKNTYARVDIKVTGTNNCIANDGWLLKIEGEV